MFTTGFEGLPQIPVMITGSLQGRIDLQGVLCKPYRVWVCSVVIKESSVRNQEVSGQSEGVKDSSGRGQAVIKQLPGSHQMVTKHSLGRRYPVTQPLRLKAISFLFSTYNLKEVIFYLHILEQF